MTTRSLAAVVALALALPLFLAPLAAAQPLGTKLRQGDKAPDFTLKDLDGKSYRLSDLLKTSVVCLDFWATWCNDCKKELPALEAIQKKHQEKGFTILGVTLDTNSAKIREIAKQNSLTYPLLIDADTKVATGLYQLTGIIPLKMVIDREGIIRYVKVGRDRADPPELDKLVTDLVGKSPP